MNKLLLFFLSVLLSKAAWLQETPHPSDIHHTFIENKGQWPENVLYYSDIPGGNVWLEKGALLYDLRDYSKLHEEHWSAKPSTRPEPKMSLVKLFFTGANLTQTATKEGESYNYYNYFIGNQPEHWASN